MPFKTFTPAVLTSAEVNTYLMQQAVIACTSSTRPASPVDGMTIYETDTDSYATYNGSSWATLGGWTTWTPTLTNMTQGNGTVTARYNRIGKRVDFYFELLLGSTSAISTTPNITLPVTATAASTFAMSVRCFDSSASQHYVGETLGATATAVSMAVLPSTAGSQLASVSATNPFTWATGDILHCHGTYEAA